MASPAVSKATETTNNGLVVATGFLTALPMRAGPPGPANLGRAAVWFPLIGLVLGVILSLAHWLLARVFPPALAAALTVALWAALTGGLHLDGLADCGDGLLAAVPPERRLEIMRDPRLGAFGGLSLVLFLIVKILAVASLPAAEAWPSLFSISPLWLAPVVGRWLILLAARQPSARAGGLGQAFADGLRPRSLLLAALLPIALALLGGLRAGLAVGLAWVIALAILRLARARLGGVTGDVFGLVVELAELTVLLTYAAASSNP
jgi:adenosylcobinamide-GDP ribazoletransferase